MSCCGKARSEAAAKTESPVRSRTTVELVYTGSTALSVKGPVSRKEYRFGQPGARVTIDSRDGAALSRLSMLKRPR
jgi:hypothetical protein